MDGWILAFVNYALAAIAGPINKWKRKREFRQKPKNSVGFFGEIS